LRHEGRRHARAHVRDPGLARRASGGSGRDGERGSTRRRVARPGARAPPADERIMSVVKNAKRLVVKVGSSPVTNEGRGLDHGAVAHWAEEIAALKREARDVVLVSSGAIAEGVKRLGWKKRPRAIHELQAAAAVGQMGLVQAYEAAFAKFGLHTAQILLTH